MTNKKNRVEYEKKKLPMLLITLTINTVCDKLNSLFQMNITHLNY